MRILHLLEMNVKDIEKQKDNLFDMRSRDEISAEEFADYRNKYKEG